jgi:arylsulfatase A-like enzyme
LAANGYTCEYYGKWHSPESKAYVYANRPITCAGMTSHPVLGLGMKGYYMNFWKSELNISTAPTQSGALTGAPGGLNYLPDALDARVIDPTLTSTVDYQNFGRTLIDARATESAMDAKHTIDAIERNKARRFSIHCSFGPPHPPFVVSAPYYGSINPTNLPYPQNYFVNSSSSAYYNASELNSPYFTYSIAKMGAYQNPATFRIFVARYYEMVKEIDDKLGEILKKLDDEGLTNKTMIIFCGDHGEMMGSHGMNSKNNFYDESARVPLIIRYPAKIAAGKKVHVPVNLIDVRPTIEDYFNLTATKVDGKTLRPFIEDTYNRNVTYFAVSEWYNDKIPGFMVRTDNHKLMIAHTAEAKNTAIDGFYNLQTDSLERINILKLPTIPQVEKNKAQELKVLLVKWLKNVNSPYYYSVKARPLGRLNANYTLYQNDIAKIKIPGITNITGLPAGSSFRILTNDTLEITTSSISSTLIGTTATISGGNSQVRFEIMPAIDYTTAVSAPVKIPASKIAVIVHAEQIEISVNSADFQHIKAKIFSVDGRLVTESNFLSKSVTFNKSLFPKGNYIVQISDGVNYKSEKFLVQ